MNSGSDGMAIKTIEITSISVNNKEDMDWFEKEYGFRLRKYTPNEIKAFTDMLYADLPELPPSNRKKQKWEE